MIRSRFFGIIFLLLFVILSGCQNESSDDPTDNADGGTKYSGAMVLAMSWQPAFCETRPHIKECRSQTADRHDADHFSLHGLWPQPGSNIYCGVNEDDEKTDKDRKWKKLPGFRLSDATMKQLRKLMPGSLSFLHRHEWVKHGTCYSKEPEPYFVDSLALLEQINGSSVQRLFADSIGKTLTNQQIRQTFDQAFGPGAGNRVRVSCKRDGKRTIITEITIGLQGRISNPPDVSKLMLASTLTKAGCPAGIVDRVGFQ